MATVLKWKIHQMDAKTSFLNGVVEEEVYVEQRLGFETHDRESHVCRLNKSPYDLRQKHPRPGTEKLIAFSPVWALPRVKHIPTFTTRLRMETH